MTIRNPELDRLRRLLEGSISVWRMRATVEEIADAPPTVLIRDNRGNSLYVTRQGGSELPPCWEVRRPPSPDLADSFSNFPARRYAAVPGMLRAVRAALDPEGRAGRLIIGNR